MANIKKNLSDAEMLKGWKDEETFETASNEGTIQLSVKPIKKEQVEDINSAYLTPELRESIGKALLELKLNLYKEGIVDYQVKVACEGRGVVLRAEPAKEKAPKQGSKPGQGTRVKLKDR